MGRSVPHPAPESSNCMEGNEVRSVSHPAPESSNCKAGNEVRPRPDPVRESSNCCTVGNEVPSSHDDVMLPAKENESLRCTSYDVFSLNWRKTGGHGATPFLRDGRNAGMSTVTGKSR